MAVTAVRAETLFFEVDEGQNTLGDYRHKRKYKAEDGQGGKQSTVTVPMEPISY